MAISENPGASERFTYPTAFKGKTLVCAIVLKAPRAPSRAADLITFITPIAPVRLRVGFDSGAVRDGFDRDRIDVTGGNQ